MSSIVDQVRDVQDQLRNQAERLGDLNLKSNNVIFLFKLSLLR